MTAPVAPEKLKELLERATPGPWSILNDDERCVVLGPEHAVADCGISAIKSRNLELPEANAALIVASVSALPAHLAQLSESEARIARLTADLAHVSRLALKFLDTILHVVEEADDSAGDQAVFGSTNDLDALREIASKLHQWRFDDRISKGAKLPDIYAGMRGLRSEVARLTEERDRLREAYRKRVVAQVHRPAYNQSTVHVGYGCDACGTRWYFPERLKELGETASEENHKPSCPLAPKDGAL